MARILPWLVAVLSTFGATPEVDAETSISHARAICSSRESYDEAAALRLWGDHHLTGLALGYSQSFGGLVSLGIPTGHIGG
ncbi:MAG TPA: hypothetical protein VFY42_02430 [Gemmatimonadales bacterium]|nr:hypothetical protein [Gemmatimonadales bacterium]